MYLLLLGIILVLLKYLAVGPVAHWPWWWTLVPFGLAALWWTWADFSGYTKRKAAEKIEKRKQERIERQKESLGLRPRKPR
ncbi:TIGR04438 family Trp-rich protein [Extensimonas vulgaris]|jgi:small Trp-rich protein|uniref:Small Trp-rich protein n=1 Tax=Extensimonas vulgaris TaxID=1031594 RepID=A0A369AQD6_9BURK|nr:TIGR04438 family Trp-rich protein [Extensimonas vulgaris]RCX11589.1 small Trp-rich protein [Extensimonas vulgaris]TWI40484.1 small Trp-rich protein [Extensimonas vulgaris]TXD16506.1 TIGR04438 family Trp-rich protein [Extensimonas vulgaris]